MADDKTGTKHEITIAVTVERTISVAEVRAYLSRKRFRLGNRQTHSNNACELYTLVPAGAMMPTTPCVFLFDNNPVELHRAVVATGRCLKRPVVDVLREIAGESVTLEDAYEVLALACHAIDYVPMLIPPGDSANLPILFVDAARVHHEARAKSVGLNSAQWIRVAQAAEDLAAIALEQLRASRGAPTGGSDG